MTVIAEEREEQILRVAKGDAERGLSVAADEKATRGELVRALFFLGHACSAAVDIAECRKERLDMCGAVADVSGDDWRHGRCNLPGDHRGTHVNDSCHTWESD